MASYQVSGAGSTDFDDLYVENGTFNGKPAYQGETNGYWLYWADVETTLGSVLLAEE